MKLHPNSTILDQFMYYIDKDESSKAFEIERAYNFLMNCFEIDVSFEPIEDDEGNEI